MSISQINEAELVNAAQVAINNTLSDSEILTLVSKRKYDQARMNQGKQLLDAVVAKTAEVAEKEGEQKQLGEECQKAKGEAEEIFQDLAESARTLFRAKGPERTKLGLIGTMPTKTGAFLKAGRTLFENAQTDAGMAEKLADVGHDAASLADGKAKIEAHDKAHQAHKKATGATQQATQEKNQAVKALRQWLSRYLRIAKLALKGKPQLREKIGIVVRTGKTEAQAAAPKKAAATRAAKKKANEEAKSGGQG